MLDLFFPPRCQVCLKFSSELICGQCQEKLRLIQSPICASCGLPLDPQATGPQECSDCRQANFAPIAWLRSAGLYDGPLRRAILALKFNGRRALARPLAELLTEAAFRGLCPDLGEFDFAVAVPLHPQRQKERGFNQSELLARYFCQQTNLELNSDLLVRTRATIPQVMLQPQQRAKNVKGAFASPEGKPAGKKILLMDDICTTGATLVECAKVLRKAGAEKVCVLTVARPRPAWMPPSRE